MANEYTSGQKLQGIGAILGGTVPQFQQEMQQLDEARMKAMYQDAGAAYQMYGQNNIAGIIDLANDRLRILQRLPGSDPSDTMQALKLAQAAQAGDQNAYSQLGDFLKQGYETGIARGYVAKPVAPEEYTLGQGDTRYRGSEVIARGAEKPQGGMLSPDAVAALGLDTSKKWQRSTTGQISEVGGSGQVINVGDQSQDLRLGLWRKIVDAIPQDMAKAQQQITLADETQTIADLLNEKDPSLFMKYIQSNYPEFGISVFDESGIMSTASALANRLAPTMREEGSGSTSDGEMRQYLLSLPNLMQSPSGRSLTAQIFQAKADIERSRIDLYNKYYDEEIDARDLARGLAQLNGKSLYTPERKRSINSIVPGFFKDTPEATFVPPPGISRSENE